MASEQHMCKLQLLRFACFGHVLLLSCHGLPTPAASDSEQLLVFEQQYVCQERIEGSSQVDVTKVNLPRKQRVNYWIMLFWKSASLSIDWRQMLRGGVRAVKPHSVYHRDLALRGPGLDLGAAYTLQCQ